MKSGPHNIMLGLDGDTEAESYVMQGARIVLAGIRAPEGSLRLDCRGAAILPGHVNAHTHVYSAFAPLGMPKPAEAPKNFLEILEKVWWRLDAAIDERALLASARLYAAEALLAGTTTIFDHHESPNFIEGSLDIIASACESLGLRAVVAYGATERNQGLDEALRGLAECARFITDNRRSLVVGAVGLHAGFTVSDETVRAAADLSRKLKAPLHIHVAEDRLDVTSALDRGYRSPVDRLRELGALIPGSIFAHGVHLSEDDVRSAALAGCWLVHNPRSNASNQVGHARLVAGGDRVALGTDGYPADMFDEMLGWAKIAEREHASDRPDPRRLAAGSRLAAEHFLARFVPPQAGTVADLVVFNPANEADEKAKVRHVIVEGRIVVQDGKLISGDIEQIRGEAKVEAKRLWERMELA